MNAIRIALAVVVLSAAARTSPAQGPASVRDSVHGGASLIATRRGLEARAAQLERAGDADSTQRAAAIRARLAEGDFNVGDRILLLVEGEKELSDTFTVGPARMLTLPSIGDIPLQGVLRSEIEPFLTRRLSESLRDPLVRARPFVRFSVQGAVMRPGFYGVPPSALLSDPIMVAGGTLQDASIKKLRIERAGQTILSGHALQEAIAQGRTVDDMGLMTGDQYVLPNHRHIQATQIVALLGIPITIYELTRIFKP